MGSESKVSGLLQTQVSFASDKRKFEVHYINVDCCLNGWFSTKFDNITCTTVLEI